MAHQEGLSMGRKAESIYTAMKKNIAEYEKRRKVCAGRRSINSFEEQMKKIAASKACYVYINGISMPVLE